jgi:6-phosphofructokinase 1
MPDISRIAVLTSGGDAPGINACIRAVTKAAIFHGLQVIGIQRGYEGLIAGDFSDMDAASVDQIVQSGGTILRSSRSERFKTPEGRKAACLQLKKARIDAVIMIGGDGSIAGSAAFTASCDIPWIGIPKTIDNDVSGTDFTIGFDTAANTALQAIDKIRDTAESHNRIHFVEVMGRDAGFIAWHAGIGTGAEAIYIPETSSDLPYLYSVLEKAGRGNKRSFIVVVAEGDEAGGAYTVSEKVKERFPEYDMAVSVLGYTQRGGSPTCSDRLLATKLGVAAVNALIKGKKNAMVGEIKGSITFTPLEMVTRRQLEVTPLMTELIVMLSA